MLCRILHIFKPRIRTQVLFHLATMSNILKRKLDTKIWSSHLQVE